MKAADLGNAAAQGQILALLGVDGAAPGATWLELGRQIDLIGLLGTPSLTRLRESPAIAVIEDLATPGMCRWLMGRCAEQLTAGLGLGDMDVVSVLAQKRLELASGLKVIQQEPPRLLSYGMGQADDEGVDFPVSSGLEVESSIATKGRRVATCLTWLNSDLEGGEAAFPRIDWRYAGRPGDSLLFLKVRSGDREPDPLSLHADMPVTQGRKWVLSQSVRDSAQPIA